MYINQTEHAKKLYAFGIKLLKAVNIRYGTYVWNKLLGHIKFCYIFKMATISKIDAKVLEIHEILIV